MSNMLTTHEVAALAGVHRDTLLRWLREGRISEPGRDRNGWRAFTQEEALAVVAFAKTGAGELGPKSRIAEVRPSYPTFPIAKLHQLDWDFVNAESGYLTHNLHPYPAKFIPQIPNALIQELSSVGDTVLDPFCGSGTTLVEALLLKRHAVGVDANPLACLISRVKTTRLSADDLNVLSDLSDRVNALVVQIQNYTLPLFGIEQIQPISAIDLPFEGVDFWFDDGVIRELVFLRSLCLSLAEPRVRDAALAILSSIIVNVSRQDSDTRYVRRNKNIAGGEATQRFSRAIKAMIPRLAEFSDLTESRFRSEVVHANVLVKPQIPVIDLVVCSPPYPNAYSYHLYHRTRMLWLGMDQQAFKRDEIGSHRKYSSKSKSGASEQTFRGEMAQVLGWIKGHLKQGGYACYVIGDSVIRGQVVHNDELLISVAKDLGFSLEANLERRLQTSRKSFNPVIGKVKDEHIVILRNTG